MFKMVKVGTSLVVGPVVKNLPCGTGDMSAIPGQQTRIPHAEGKPGLCTKLESVHRNKKSPC